MTGFFSSAPRTLTPVGSLLPKCGACGLWETCRSPKIPVQGQGRKKILICGEGPGKSEDDRGTFFIGESGQLLFDTLDEFGIFREDCWITNSVICRTSDKNRKPSPREIEFCRPNVFNAIRDLNPEVIILLGDAAVNSVIPLIWEKSVGSIGRWVGWTIPCQKWNAWICPTYHPAYLLRDRGQKGREGGHPVLNRMFRDHLGKAVSLAGRRPWDPVPDYRGRVERVYDPDEAWTRLRDLVRRNIPTAFDYETTTLKPDGDLAEIVCCSVSNGETTFAYPWHGKAIEATGLFLRSPVPKIASNLKFEERWTRREFGFRVKNWSHDTMLVAHLMDTRRGVSGLKFQSLIRLGMGDYDSHVKPYLEGEGGNGKNRVRDLSMDDLLLYCGMDSLLELEVAKHQRKEMRGEG